MSWAFLAIGASSVTAADSARALLADITSSEIVRIEIYYVPAASESVVALSPKGVIARADHKVVLGPRTFPQTKKLLLEALESAEAEPLPRDPRYGALHMDLRWGCRFYDAASQLRYELYLDAFRERGIVQGSPYKFSSALSEWLAKNDKK